jgi:hypothetical protein
LWLRIANHTKGTKGNNRTISYTDLFFTFQYTVYRLLIIW